MSDSFDAADNWIAERVGPGDIVVTADIPLAVPKHASAPSIRRSRSSNIFTVGLPYRE